MQLSRLQSTGRCGPLPHTINALHPQQPVLIVFIYFFIIGEGVPTNIGVQAAAANFHYSAECRTAFSQPTPPLLKGSSGQITYGAVVSSYIALPAWLQQLVMGADGSLAALAIYIP